MLQNHRTILSAEITELLETIKEQFETLNACEGKIPVLEFDILKDNIRRLYEKLGQMQLENAHFDLPFQKEQEISKEPVKLQQQDDEISEPDLSSDEIPVKDIQEKEKTGEPKEEPMRFDLFSSERSAFNEKLKEAREQSLGPRLGQSAPSDIKSLININDKFLFINDLFDGDYKEYSHAIEIFNNFEEKGEAFEFLDSLLKDNLWNSASPAFQKLKEIVEKRFS